RHPTSHLTSIQITPRPGERSMLPLYLMTCGGGRDFSSFLTEPKRKQLLDFFDRGNTAGIGVSDPSIDSGKGLLVLPSIKSMDCLSSSFMPIALASLEFGRNAAKTWPRAATDSF